jgi:hypothetical protein
MTAAQTEPDTWPVNRVATLSGWAEPTLRRWVAANPLHAELLHMRSLHAAVIAAKALLNGHDIQSIRVLNSCVHLSSGLWLVSSPGQARISGSLLRAAAHIESNPSERTIISNIGQLTLDVDAH